jgi:hypothetical protein
VVRVCIPPLSSHLSGTAAVTPPPVPTSRPITPVPPYLPDPSPIRSPETLPTTSSISDVRLPHIPTSPSAYTSQEPSRLSTIDESPSSESPSISYSSSSPSVTVCSGSVTRPSHSIESSMLTLCYFLLFRSTSCSTVPADLQMSFPPSTVNGSAAADLASFMHPSTPLGHRVVCLQPADATIPKRILGHALRGILRHLGRYKDRAWCDPFLRP